MKLESQVCSLEYAKRLKELGVKQESLFYWSFYDGGFSEEEPGITLTDEANHGFEEDLLSAFTVAELGEMLPKQIEYKVTDYGDRSGYRSMDLKTGKTIINDGWYVMYRDPHPSNEVPIHSQYADTEADARREQIIAFCKELDAKNE